MKKIEFIKAVYDLKEIPKKDFPVVLLGGRSNVGKSSFINSLFYPAKVAKTSSTPGKTRSINYYIAENKFYLVDLPGFGYAKVSKTERDYWQKIIENFIAGNKNIAFAFHLIDSRHKPTSLDIQLNDFLRLKNVPYNIILNKVDKLKQSEIAAAKRNLIECFPELIFGENLFLFSAITGFGKKEIIRLMSALLL